MGMQLVTSAVLLSRTRRNRPWIPYVVHAHDGWSAPSYRSHLYRMLSTVPTDLRTIHATEVRAAFGLVSGSISRQVQRRRSWLVGIRLASHLPRVR